MLRLAKKGDPHLGPRSVRRAVVDIEDKDNRTETDEKLGEAPQAAAFGGLGP